MKRKKLKKSQKIHLETAFGRRCGFDGCRRPAEVVHHPVRYAYARSNERLVPLCKIHHELAHFGLIANERDPPGKWLLRRLEERPLLFGADKKWATFRKRVVE